MPPTTSKKRAPKTIGGRRFSHGAAAATLSEALRREILAGRYAASEPLRQDAIARRFQTSRVPVREALRQLEAEGLVTFVPHRGACVASLDLADVLQMLEIRAALEPHVLRIAIPNLTGADLDAAARLLADAERCASPARLDRINWNFHAALYLPARRPRLFGLVKTNYFRATGFIRERIAAGDSKQPHEQHRRILELCREGAAEDAAGVLETHINETRKRVATEIYRSTSGRR